MTEERLVEIESKLAHQDQLVYELNDVVTNQQAKIMQLETLVESLLERVRALGDAAPAGSVGDERPPHY
ncbi:MAG: SlyX family protein [Pseudomonadota bacterium]